VKLWSKRRPALAGVLVASGALTVGLITTLAVEYREQSAYVRSIVDAQQLNDRMMFGANLLPTLWMMEQISSVSIMGRGKFDEFMFNNRFSLLNTEIERAYVDGRQNHIMTMVWELTLAHWVLQSPDHRESVSTLLSQTKQKLEDLLNPEDELLEYVEMLEAVSTIRDSWFPRGPESSHEPIDLEILDRVAAAAVVVEAYLGSLTDVEKYSPAHLLGARALKHAYSGKLLNIRDKYIFWTSEIKRLEHGHLVPRDPPRAMGEALKQAGSDR